MAVFRTGRPVFGFDVEADTKLVLAELLKMKAEALENAS
jgi:hypothetical protein